MIHHGDTDKRTSSSDLLVGLLNPSNLIVTMLLILLVMLIACWQPMEITFRRWRMQSAWEVTFSEENAESHGGLVGYQLGDTWDAFEAHRDWLVDAGSLDFHDFRFAHIKQPTVESRHVLHRLLANDCPPSLDWASPSSTTSAPLVVHLWCETEDSLAWEKFISLVDVRDYRERFMSDIPPASNE